MSTDAAPTTALAIRADQTEWTPAQKAALEQLGIGDAPIGDQLVFLHVSQRMGLDPFNKEIYMIGRWDREAQKKKWSIQIGIDGFRSRSEEHPEYGGIDGPHWCGKDGQWRDVWLEDAPPMAARFTVYRKDWEHPIYAVAHFKEYVQKKSDGKPTRMWTEMAAHMIGKVAEALARRKAFPRKLTGLYLDEELQHLDNPPGAVIIDGETETPAEPDWDGLVVKAIENRDLSELKRVYDLARGMKPNDRPLLEKIASAKEKINNTPQKEVAVPEPDPEDSPDAYDPLEMPAAQSQRNHIFGLLSDGGVEGSQRAARLRIVNRILNRPPTEPITSFNELTVAHADTVTDFLQRHKDEGDLTHTLVELASNGNGNNGNGNGGTP